MRVSLKSKTLIGLMCVLATPVFAARKERPSGAEIAQKARLAVLDSANSATAEKNGKKIKFTPANLDQVKGETELEEGQALGLLENEAPGDETGLPPGKYNLFAAKVGNDWHVYAESGGNIVGEGIRVRVEKGKGSKKKAEIRPEGFTMTVKLGDFYFHVAW